jgi:hypothetical protein
MGEIDVTVLNKILLLLLKSGYERKILFMPLPKRNIAKNVRQYYENGLR